MENGRLLFGFFLFVPDVCKPWILVDGGNSGNSEYTPHANLLVTPAVHCEGWLAFFLLKTLRGHLILPISCEAAFKLPCVGLCVSAFWRGFYCDLRLVWWKVESGVNINHLSEMMKSLQVLFIQARKKVFIHFLGFCPSYSSGAQNVRLCFFFPFSCATITP